VCLCRSGARAPSENLYRQITSAHRNHPAWSRRRPKSGTRTPSRIPCNVNWPAASSPSVRVKLHVSQSQKKIGAWPVLALPGFEVISPDLAVINDSDANSLPLPSFRKEARHTGLAHLPSMGILYVEFSGRIPDFAHDAQIVGTSQSEMIWRANGGRFFRRYPSIDWTV